MWKKNEKEYSGPLYDWQCCLANEHNDCAMPFYGQTCLISAPGFVNLPCIQLEPAIIHVQHSREVSVHFTVQYVKIQIGRLDSNLQGCSTGVRLTYRKLYDLGFSHEMTSTIRRQKCKFLQLHGSLFPLIQSPISFMNNLLICSSFHAASSQLLHPPFLLQQLLSFSSPTLPPIYIYI